MLEIKENRASRAKGPMGQPKGLTPETLLYSTASPKRERKGWVGKMI
jgi:hypothetical protein